MMYKVIFTFNGFSESWEVMYLNTIVLDIIKEKLKKGFSIKIDKI